MTITKLAVNLLAGLALSALGCSGVAHAETPYSYCLKTDGVPYDSDPGRYISVGKKVLNDEQHGYPFMQVVEELENEGAPPNVAAAIAACASKVNCPDLLHCGP